MDDQHATHSDPDQQGQNDETLKEGHIDIFFKGLHEVLELVGPARDELSIVQTMNTQCDARDEDTCLEIIRLKQEVRVVRENNEQLAAEKDNMRKQLLEMKIDNYTTEELERQKLKDTIAANETLLTNAEETNNEICNLRDEYKRLEAEKDEMHNQLIDLEREGTATKDELQLARQTISEHENNKLVATNISDTIAKLEDKLLQQKQKTDHYQSELDQAIKEKDNKIVDAERRFNDTLSSLIEEKKKLSEKLVNSKQENEQMERELLEHRNNAEMYTANAEVIDKLKYRIKQLEVDTKKLEEENSTKQSRIGHLLSKTISENNPEITNLSEEYRPTKVAELYNELYDNQWTDAFEVSERMFADKSEAFQIKVLGRVLVKVHQFCQKEFAEQDKDIMQAFSRSSETALQLPTSIQRTLNECKRQSANLGVDVLFEKVMGKFKTDIKSFAQKTPIKSFAQKTPTYVKECVRVCWMMVLQDPPIVFHQVTRHSLFDSSIYKPYTTSGDKVEYIAWPALLLHANGPVLAKGVVQCYKSDIGMTPSTTTQTNIDTGMQEDFDNNLDDAVDTKQPETKGTHEEDKELRQHDHAIGASAVPTHQSQAEVGSPKIERPTDAELKKYKFWTLHNSDAVVKYEMGKEIYAKCKRYSELKEKLS